MLTLRATLLVIKLPFSGEVISEVRCSLYHTLPSFQNFEVITFIRISSFQITLFDILKFFQISACEASKCNPSDYVYKVFYSGYYSIGFTSDKSHYFVFKVHSKFFSEFFTVSHPLYTKLISFHNWDSMAFKD